MTKDKKPKPPTEAEARILQEARAKHAAEFQAIRERICPSSSPFGQETARAVNLDDITTGGTPQ